MSSTTQSGVGSSHAENSEQAAREAVTSGLTAAGLEECDLALVFATTAHDPKKIVAGARAAAGPGARILGCAAIGVIAGRDSGFQQSYVGAAVVKSQHVAFDILTVANLSEREEAAGVELARQLAKGPMPQAMLLLFDLVRDRGIEDPRRHRAAAFLESVCAALPSWPMMAGAGLYGDVDNSESFYWVDDTVCFNGAATLVLSGRVRMDTCVMHSCRPSSDYHAVTAVEGNSLVELDGKPAVEVISKLLGPEVPLDWADIPFFLVLGENLGAPYAPYVEENYVLRMCIHVDRARGSLEMYGDDLKVGSRIQVMRRRIDFDEMERRAEALLRRPSNPPFLAFYVDCTARRAVFANTEREDVDVIHRTIGSKVPLIGCYSGSEFTTLAGRPYASTWTGVLCLLSET